MADLYEENQIFGNKVAFYEQMTVDTRGPQTKFTINGHSAELTALEIEELVRLLWPVPLEWQE